ncbi:hypothetical protein GCM10028777_25560 [Angustibacter speluncae]
MDEAGARSVGVRVDHRRAGVDGRRRLEVVVSAVETSAKVSPLQGGEAGTVVQDDLVPGYKWV